MEQNRLFEDSLYWAWKEFVTVGEVRKESIRSEILDSWERCKKLGIDPFQKKAPYVLNEKELAFRRKRKSELITTSLPVMQNLNAFVEGSGFIVILADEDGFVIEISGNQDVVQTVQRGNFIPGADWSEAGAGTNAVGTSLQLNRSIQVFSYEHYCVSSHNWTCSGCPIHDPEGRIIGVINMSGPYEKVHDHTLGMVVAAANAIENLLVLQQALRYKTTIMESISEGVLAVNCDGIVTHLNEAGEKLLQTKDAIGRPVVQVLGEKNSTFLEYAMNGNSITDQEIDIARKSGRIACTVTARPIRNKNDRNKGFVLVLNEMARARRLVQRMVGAQAKFSFNDLVGKNPRFMESMRIGKAAAGSTSNVLLLGESGTGKDLFAQAIHNESYRFKGPFVAINCAAIPRELIGSELFGYSEGAFTGAKRGGSPGKFELADGGTLFLDEIGEMPLELQTTLLRVLEQGSIVRIGGQEVIPVDVRIIAATNRNLLEQVRKGHFRQDLFYRLNVITINLVPLRERKDDIPILVDYFMSKMNFKMGKELRGVEEAVWKQLSAFDWPGNIRELQNILERAANINTSGRLSIDDLPPELQNTEPSDLPSELQNAKQSEIPQLNSPLRDYEREMIINLMKEYDGNITKVAKRLGVARTTLYRKMKKLEIGEIN